MINAYYEMLVTTPKGDKLKMVFVDTDIMFDAHLKAQKMGFTTNYYENIQHGYSIMRKESDYTDYLNAWK